MAELVLRKIKESDLTGAVARAWCTERNSHKEMDVVLGRAIVIEVAQMLSANGVIVIVGE